MFPDHYFQSLTHNLKVRILGATLIIISQTTINPSFGLITVVGVVQGLGLSRLLLTTAPFVGNM